MIFFTHLHSSNFPVALVHLILASLLLMNLRPGFWKILCPVAFSLKSFKFWLAPMGFHQLKVVI